MSDSSTPAPRECPAPSRPRSRGWFRFSLRTLLIAAPLVAIGLGIGFRAWYAHYLERLAVEEIELLGGLVARNAAGEVVSVDLLGAKINDEKLLKLVPHLGNLRQLETLVLVSNGVTDEGLLLLAQVPHLQTLHLADTLATEQGIAKLKGLRPGLNIVRSNPHLKATRLARRPVFEHAILSLALAPGGQQILAGSGDGRLQVFDLHDDEQYQSFRAHEEWTFAVAFQPDDKRLATGGGDGLIKLWSWPDLAEVGRFVGHTDDIHAIAFTPDGTTLVSTGDDKKVRVWDVATREQRHCLAGHTDTIPGVAISPDGRLAASASRDDTIRLWSIEGGECVGILWGHAGDVMSVDFHPLGSELASASYDGTLIAWDLATQKPIRKYEGHADWVFAVRYSPRGDQLVSAGGDGVRMWNRRGGRPVWHEPAPKNASYALWLSPEELAASSAGGSITLLGVERGDAVATLWTRIGAELGFAD